MEMAEDDSFLRGMRSPPSPPPPPPPRSVMLAASTYASKSADGAAGAAAAAGSPTLLAGAAPRSDADAVECREHEDPSSPLLLPQGGGFGIGNGYVSIGGEGQVENDGDGGSPGGGGRTLMDYLLEAGASPERLMVDADAMGPEVLSVLGEHSEEDDRRYSSDVCGYDRNRRGKVVAHGGGDNEEGATPQHYPPESWLLSSTESLSSCRGCCDDEERKKDAVAEPNDGKLPRRSSGEACFHRAQEDVAKRSVDIVIRECGGADGYADTGSTQMMGPSNPAPWMQEVEMHSGDTGEGPPCPASSCIDRDDGDDDRGEATSPVALLQEEMENARATILSATELLGSMPKSNPAEPANPLAVACAAPVAAGGGNDAMPVASAAKTSVHASGGRRGGSESSSLRNNDKGISQHGKRGNPPDEKSRIDEWMELGEKQLQMASSSPAIRRNSNGDGNDRCAPLGGGCGANIATTTMATATDTNIGRTTAETPPPATMAKNPFLKRGSRREPSSLNAIRRVRRQQSPVRNAHRSPSAAASGRNGGDATAAAATAAFATKIEDLERMQRRHLERLEENLERKERARQWQQRQKQRQRQQPRQQSPQRRTNVGARTKRSGASAAAVSIAAASRSSPSSKRKLRTEREQQCPVSQGGDGRGRKAREQQEQHQEKRPVSSSSAGERAGRTTATTTAEKHGDLDTLGDGGGGSEENMHQRNVAATASNRRAAGSIGFSGRNNGGGCSGTVEHCVASPEEITTGVEEGKFVGTSNDAEQCCQENHGGGDGTGRGMSSSLAPSVPPASPRAGICTRPQQRMLSVGATSRGDRKSCGGDAVGRREKEDDERQQRQKIKWLRKRQEALLREAEREREAVRAWATAEKASVISWAAAQRDSIERERHKVANESLLVRRRMHQARPSEVPASSHRKESHELDELRATTLNLKVEKDKEVKKHNLKEKQLSQKIKEQKLRISELEDLVTHVLEQRDSEHNTSWRSEGSCMRASSLATPPMLSDVVNRNQGWGITSINTPVGGVGYKYSSPGIAIGNNDVANKVTGRFPSSNVDAREGKSPNRCRHDQSAQREVVANKERITQRKTKPVSDLAAVSKVESRDFRNERHMYNDAKDTTANHGSMIGESNGVGKLQRNFSDGKQVVRYENGTQKELHRNGHIVVKFANGDVKQTLADGTEVYCYSNFATTQTTYPDGVQVFEFANKQKERHFPSGRKVIEFLDSTKKIIHTNGATETIFPDGSPILEHVDDQLA